MGGFACFCFRVWPIAGIFVSFVNKKSYWKLEKFDYLCGFFSLLALVLWGITKNPLIAIIFAIASDGFASLPTLIKLWRYPETETIAPYSTGLFNAVTSFFAVKTWSIKETAFPVYLVIACSALLAVAARPRFAKKQI